MSTFEAPRLVVIVKLVHDCHQFDYGHGTIWITSLHSPFIL